MIALTELEAGQKAQITAIGALDSVLKGMFDDIGLSVGSVIALVHRGVGRRGALAVQVGEAVFAVRYPDAGLIEVQPL